MDTRSASSKYKGFRLQKLRLLIKMFELIKINPEIKIVGMVEYKDDIYITSDNNADYFEQNKDYSTNFSLNSLEVQKTFINFLDNYLDSSNDTNLVFCFYTNVSYSKEHMTEELRLLNLFTLDKPFFEYFLNNDLVDEVINFFKKIIINNFDKIYSHYNKENFEKIKKFTNKDWILFLKSIEFKFNCPDHEELEPLLLEQIEAHPLFQITHLNKIEIIKSVLLEKIDISMSKLKLLDKMINSDSISLVFYQVLSEVDGKKIDPLYNYWKEIMKFPLEDTRNISEKIKHVSDNFSEKTIQRYNREAIFCNVELENLDIRFRDSLKVRIYESMDKYFDNKFLYKPEYKEEELKDIIKELQKEAKTYISSLKQNYDYVLLNEEILEKIVVMLINECYFSFDR